MFESTTDAGTLAGQLRMRRLRRTGALRALVRETTLSVDNFIHPLFIAAGKNIERPIGSMAGHSQLSIDKLDAEIDTLLALRIPAVLLFGIRSEDTRLNSSHPRLSRMPSSA